MTWRLIVRASSVLGLFTLASILLAIVVGTQSDALVLAYVSADQTIHIYDTQHGFDQPLSQPIRRDHSPAWSPDGRYLAYASSDGLGDDVLHLLDTRNYTIIRITAPEGNTRYDQPRWTPDSRDLLVQQLDGPVSSRNVVRFSVETKQVETLDIDHPQAQAYLEDLASNPSGLISPDGSAIVVLTDGRNGTEVGIQREDSVVTLQEAPSAVEFEWYASATWLADNRFFLTTLRIREGSINTGWLIYIIDSHDEVPARLLIDGGNSPAPRP